MEIFSLFGSIFVDNEKANKGIDKTSSLASKLAKKFKSVGKIAGKLGKGIAIGVAAGGAAMLALAAKTGEAADRLLDLSSTTGMSTDELQRWEKVTTVAGVSADAVSKISEKFTKDLEKLGKETGKSREAADELGLSYEELSQMNADERMNALTEALQGVEDPTKRAELGTALLGGQWKNMAPILDVGADKLKNIKENANIISNDDLNQANEFRIAIDKMKEKAVDFGQKLALKFIPILNIVFEWFDKNSGTIETLFNNAFEAMGKGLNIFVTFIKEKVMPVLIILFDWVQQNMPIIKSVWERVFKGIKAVVMLAVDVFNDFWLPILKTIFEWIVEHMPEIEAVFKTVFDVIKIAIQLSIDTIQFLWDILVNLLKYVSGGFQKIGGWIKGAFEGVTDFIQEVVDVINAVVEGISKAIDAVIEFFNVADREADERVTRGGSLGFSDFGSLADEFTQTNEFTSNQNLVLPGPAGATQQQILNQFDIKEMNVRNDEDVKNVANELYNLQIETNRGNGSQ